MLKLNRILVVSCAAVVTMLMVGCGPEAKNAAPSAGTKNDPVRATPASTGDESKPATSGPELSPPKTDSGDKPAANDGPGPQQHTTFFRGDEPASKMPKVMLSPHEEALCRVKVGDAMPAIELPKLDGSGKAKLSELRGKKATVVVFWKADRRMALEQIADLGPDVIEPFGKDGVTVVGIAVNEPAASAKEAVEKAGAKFTNLLDSDGKALALVGKERLPRTYVVDANGKIVWFDITYSLTTRRELHDALRVLTGEAGK